jgi:parvulin-like peptidyl-prolyl isomerase
MRSAIVFLVVSVGSLLAAGQTSSSQAANAAVPKSAASQGVKSGSQGAPGKSPSAKPESPVSKELGPDAAVITIKGLCPTSASRAPASKATGKSASTHAAAKPCETVVTKKDLDLVIDTVRPNMPPPQRRMLAQQYVELLTIANAATKAGLEKEAKVKEQMRLSKLQILASNYSRQMQQKEAEVPEADIQKYYKENASKYEEAKLLRIYVPMVVKEEGKPPDAAATKALAEKIQQRAAAGEDFDKLQKEAFTAAASKGTPPSVDMGERRRGTLPPKQEDAVFGMKAGEVSPALEEASGFYIYKVVSKDQVPLEKVHDEIKGTLARERFRESIEKLRSSVETTYNDAYFSSPAPPATAGAPAQTPSVHAPGAAEAPAATPGQTTSPAQPGPPAQPATPSGGPEPPKTPPPAPPK